MAKFTMRGARLAHCVTQSNKEGGVFVRINARCDYTKAIRDEHGWVELPVKSKNMDLEGGFGAGIFKIDCQQSTLEGTASVEMPYTEISTYRAVRVKDKDQESTRVELRFHVVTTHPDAGRLCQLYKTLAKKALGEMTVRVGATVPDATKSDPAQPMLTEADSNKPVTVVEIMKINGHQRNGKKSKAQQLSDAAASEAPTVSAGPEDAEAEGSERAIAASLSGQESGVAVQ